MPERPGQRAFHEQAYNSLVPLPSGGNVRESMHAGHRLV